MDQQTQEMFDQLIAMDQESLNDEQKGFLMARRGYFNDEQRKRYASMIEAHEKGTLVGKKGEDENDLSTLSLAKLKAIAKEEEVEVTGLKTVAEFVKAIKAHREDAE
jgi:hypothetical protein